MVYTFLLKILVLLIFFLCSFIARAEKTQETLLSYQSANDNKTDYYSSIYTSHKKHLASLLQNALEDSSNVQKIEEESIKKHYVEDEFAQALYQIAKDTTDLFSKHKIEYFMSGGTTLGAVRHKGLIPWDNDVDLVIFHQDEIKFNQLTSDFNKLGYKINYVKNFRYVIDSNQVLTKPGMPNPGIDIFVMHYNKEKKIVEYIDENNRSLFPLEWYPESVLFPLKKYNFGPLKLNGPNNAEWYLDHYYGQTWRDTMIISGHTDSPNFGITRKVKKFTPKLPSKKLMDRVFSE